MNLRDAKDQVEREHPELKGTERMLAIKALRDQPDPAGPTTAAPEAPEQPAGNGDYFCRNCDQPVKPVVRNVWGKVVTFVALLQLVAVAVSVVSCFTSVDVGDGLRRLASWPAAIHPVGVGVVAALAAFIAAVGVAGSLTQRAERGGTCPKCKSVLATQPGASGE
ncbi:hypothetical protein NMG29_06640 [Streptomyces cocklensis]|uniref:Uncharacterized protein n=1 Tax=Actinacidiphila cocklensis TaxID=887465 RepID=A0A9W4GPV5_9ACTN|nr:hypothetical protein [Actinacidiphila cocklensis]MDD1057909.1 hypothetical protein [Actinacidiphila cocklensis]CAG6392773.1 conserved hypothetical protein [Actinacidiphila cocklensis]